jgi:F-type H+-transporting ATPase subunit b
MGLITPDYGLLFWMLLSFGIVLYILKKFAWKPILQGIKHREEQIAKSLREADRAREEIAKLQAQNLEMSNLARQERDSIMLEAKSFKERMVKEASEKAQEETKKYLEQARLTIAQEKETAMAELKASALELSLKLSEIILRREIKDKDNYEKHAKSLLNEIATKN